MNYNLLNGILDQTDIEDTLNPLGIRGTNITTALQDYSKIKPKIDLLVGESVKRPFEFVIRAVNPTTISEREESLKKIVMAELTQLIDPTKTPDQSDQELQRKIKKLERMSKYDWKDQRELMGQHILNYLYKKNDMDILFMRGMEDVLVASEELVAFDIRNGEPFIEKISPLNLTALRMGNSSKVEDADIILIDGYYPIGYILDNFSEVLTDTQVADIEEGHITRMNSDGLVSVPNDWFAHEQTSEMADGFSGLQFLTPGSDSKYFGDAYDRDGNVRLIRVIWKSMRKMGVLKYFNEEGIELSRFVDEYYKIDKTKGEEVKWRWVTEFWHGYRISEDIFIKMEVLPRIGSNIDNPTKCIGPIVGTIYNVDQEVQKSMVDLLKPYEYLHAEIMNRLRKAVNRFRMPSADVDIAAIPDFLEIEDWIYYDQEVGYRFKDSMREADKGSAQGKIVGANQSIDKLFNPDMRNYIDQHLLLLNYIDQEMGFISGITKQREGQIETRELVGNVEVARTQSSHITEKIFALHDNHKIRVLTTFLEFAKYAYRNDANKKLSYISDDLATTTLNINGPLMAEAELGLFVSNSRNDYELRSSLKTLAQSMMQNNIASVTDIIAVMQSSSIVEMRKKLEESEEDRNELERSKIEQVTQIAQQAAETLAAEKKADRELKDRMNIRDNQVKLSLGLKEDLEEVNDGLEEEKLQLQQKKTDADIKNADGSLKETIRSNKAKEKIANKKPVNSSKK